MDLTDEEVLEMSVDEYLEHMDLEPDDFIEGSDMTVGDFIQHYGVMGMHWGIRKSRSETGISRARGAIIDRNERSKHVIELASSGRKFRGTAAVGRAFLGRERQQANWKMQTARLNAQNARMRSGRITVSDRLDMIGSLSVSDLYVSVRPNRSDPRWHKNENRDN